MHLTVCDGMELFTRRKYLFPEKSINWKQTSSHLYLFLYFILKITPRKIWKGQVTFVYCTKYCWWLTLPCLSIADTQRPWQCLTSHFHLHGCGGGTTEYWSIQKRKKKLESGTVEFMNESALAANHSHYSPQPPQNCCVIGRELFPMQRSLLSVPTHQRQCTTLRNQHLWAASLPSWEAGS